MKSALLSVSLLMTFWHHSKPHNVLKAAFLFQYDCATKSAIPSSIIAFKSQIEYSHSTQTALVSACSFLGCSKFSGQNTTGSEFVTTARDRDRVLVPSHRNKVPSPLLSYCQFSQYVCSSFISPLCFSTGAAWWVWGQEKTMHQNEPKIFILPALIKYSLT